MCVLQLDRTIFFFGKGLVNDFTANILVQKAETGKISQHWDPCVCRERRRISIIIRDSALMQPQLFLN
jgi:hypothetical protein